MNKDKSNFKYVSEGDFIRGAYIKIPKNLYRGDKYKSLSNDAILLYGILLDRFTLSALNNIRDKDGRVYVMASLESITKILNIGKDKARNIINSLDKLDLIKIEKMGGFNKSRRLYLGEVLKEKRESNSAENPTFEGGESSTIKVGFSHPNNTDKNNTNLNNRKYENQEKDRCNYSYLDEFNFDY